MKNLLIIIVLSLFPCSLYSQEVAKDTTHTALPLKATLPDSIVRQLDDNAKAIDSLMNQNKVLNDLIDKRAVEKDSISKQNVHKIVSLQNEIAASQQKVNDLKKENEKLQRQLISMASNFLYIPYEEYSINEIAIKAFESTQGTSVYMKYQNRLPLIQNYKADIAELITFLKSAERKIKYTHGDKKKIKAKELVDALKLLSLYKHYTAYEDWKNTYLGQKICLIQKILDVPDSETLKQLETIRTNLEQLINEN